MVKKAITGIMLTLLLISVIHFAAVNSVGRATSFSSDLLNLGVLSETEDSWWMFRHDLNHTGYSNSTVPIPLDEMWNTNDIINDSVRSSPAVVDGKVYVGSSDGNVYLLDAVRGHKIENYTTDGAVESSPAVVGDMVFVGSMNGTVYALSANDLSHEWSSSIDGAVKSSSAFADGKIFLGSDDGYVYALDATTGNEIWKSRTAYAVNSSPAVSGGRVFIGVSDGRVYAFDMMGRYEWYFVTDGAVESSPAVAEGKVFVGSDDGKVYALNETTGHEIWSNSTGDAVKSSPAVAYGRVFIGSMNGSVYALNATTGNFLWNFPTKDFVYSSPAVADGKVFVGSGDNRIYVLNATTGSHLWNYTTGGPIYSSPAIARAHKDRVFIGSDDMKVYAFGPENKLPQPKIDFRPEEPFILQTVTFDGSESGDPDGEIVGCTWNFGDGTPKRYYSWGIGKIMTHAYGAAGNYTVTLTVEDNHPNLPETNDTSRPVTVQEAWPMYRHDWSHKGYSTSLAPVTNRTLWNLTIGPDASWDTLMYPSPAVIDGVVYIGATNGTVYALDAINGSKMWNNTLSSYAIHSSPAVADGMVFIGSDDQYVYALNATSGDIVWKYKSSGQVISSPAVAYGKVFITSRDGRLHALPETDPDSNGIIDPAEIEWTWRHPVGGEVESSPAIADGMVFFGSLDHKIYVLLDDPNGNGKIDDHEVKWIWPTGGSIYSSPAVDRGIVFVGSGDGKVYAFNVTTGEEEWSEPVGGVVRSSPAIVDGKVFVGSKDGNIYAFSINGTELWKAPIGEVGWSSPAVAEDKVFIGSADGIYALDIDKDGEEVWSYQKGGPVDSSPAVLNDTLYVASENGTLYAFWGQIRDVAITKVTPSRTIVAQNETVDISVTVENQGSFDETNINVTTYYFNATTNINVANSTVILNLPRHNKTTISLAWNTTSVEKGTYKISANATLTIDEDPADNYRIDGNVTIDGRRDINVTDVWPMKTIIGQGYNVTIYVTVKNEGNVTETDIKVTLYYDNIAIGTQTAPDLAQGANTTLTFTWDTTGIAKGKYTISANATIATDDDPGDNTRTDGTVLVTIPGDVNGDCMVDMADIDLISYYFGEPCSACPNCDVNCDCTIDMADKDIATYHFGESWPC